LTILEAKLQISTSPDQKQKVAQVSYPMPIWVPFARNIFGEDLVASSNYDNSPEGRAIKTVFSLMNKPEPNLSFKGVNLPVRWITYQESTHNEGYRE
jgi:hypothetical protein